MTNTIILLVIALFLVIILAVYAEYDNYNMKKKLTSKAKSSIVENTIQKMFDILGSDIDTNKKIDRLNNVIISAFKPKYSSIVLFDGQNHIMKSTNVEECYIDVIKDVSQESIFSGCISKDTSKYLISKVNNIVSYKSALERGIKSVMFSPIFYDDVYLGFWIIEDDRGNAFDNISESDFKKFKYNLGLFVQNIGMQSTIEIAENTDIQTGLYNRVHLYSNSRKILSKSETSSITMIELKNIPEINEKYGRNIGNTLILKMCNAIKDIVSKESVLVRYSGLRFLIITPSSNAQIAQPVIERVQQVIKSISEFVDDEEVKLSSSILIHTLQKQNNIEKEIQKMMSYMEKMKDTDSIRIM